MIVSRVVAAEWQGAGGDLASELEGMERGNAQRSALGFSLTNSK